MKQSDSQLVKGTSVQKTKGKHCGRVLKDCLRTHQVGRLVATAEGKGVSGLCPVCTAAAHTCELNVSAKREGLRIAPDKLQASYHIKPNDSNSPMCFHIFPEGQEGQKHPIDSPRLSSTRHSSRGLIQRDTTYSYSDPLWNPQVSWLCHQFCIYNHCKVNQNNICWECFLLRDTTE